MKFIMTLFSMMITLFVIFCIFDITRHLYKKFKNLFLSVYTLRQERKQKKKSPKIESIHSNVQDQYKDVINGVGEYIYHEKE